MLRQDFGSCDKTLTDRPITGQLTERKKEENEGSPVRCHGPKGIALEWIGASGLSWYLPRYAAGQIAASPSF